jgi:hypothetical protein
MTAHPLIRCLAVIGFLLTADTGDVSSSASAQDFYEAPDVVQRPPKSPVVAQCGPAGCPASARPAASPWYVYPNGVSGYTSYSVPHNNAAPWCSPCRPPCCLFGCRVGNSCGAAGCPNQSNTVTHWYPTFGPPGSMSSRVRQIFGVARPTYTIEPPRTPSAQAPSPKPADAFYSTSGNPPHDSISTTGSTKPFTNPESPFYP